MKYCVPHGIYYEVECEDCKRSRPHLPPQQPKRKDKQQERLT